MNKEAILEGLLFVVGEDGLTLKQIQDILEISEEEANLLVMQLKESLEDSSRGLRINYLGGCYKLTTKQEHKFYYQKLLLNEDNNTLTQASLETLAIIAYNQPLTRLRVDELRGVSTAHIVRKLVAKGLIKESGRSNSPGRPILYQTTNEFLDYFGIESLKDLPNISIENQMSNKNEDQELDLYLSNYKEEEMV